MITGAARQVISFSDTRVRCLRPGESLDPTLGGGLENLPLEHSWVWLLEHDNTNVACLIAVPVHGVALLLRIASLPSAPPMAIPRLLKKSLADMVNRGYKAYMVHLDLSKEAEKVLAKVVLRAGGKVMGQGVMLGGPTDYHGRNPWGS